MSILLPVSVLHVSSGGGGFSESWALLWFAEIQHRVRPERLHHRQSESSCEDGQRRYLHLRTGERIWHRYRHTTEETYFCWPYYNKAANNVKHVYANAPTYKHFIAPPDKKMHEEWVHRLWIGVTNRKIWMNFWVTTLKDIALLTTADSVSALCGQI